MREAGPSLDPMRKNNKPLTCCVRPEGMFETYASVGYWVSEHDPSSPARKISTPELGEDETDTRQLAILD